VTDIGMDLMSFKCRRSGIPAGGQHAQLGCMRRDSSTIAAAAQGVLLAGPSLWHQGLRR
jgi:hypothetical protein